MGGALTAFGALVAITSVLLVILYGQTRIFFAMARDGLVPESWATVDARTGTPVKLTLGFGIFAAPRRGIAIGRDRGDGEHRHAVRIHHRQHRRDGAEEDATDMDSPSRCRSPTSGARSGSCSASPVSGLPLATYIRFVGWLAVRIVIYLIYGYSHSRLRHHYRRTGPARRGTGGEGSRRILAGASDMAGASSSGTTGRTPARTPSPSG